MRRRAAQARGFPDPFQDSERTLFAGDDLFLGSANNTEQPGNPRRGFSPDVFAAQTLFANTVFAT